MRMASSVKYSEDQLNYFRICYVTTDILTEGLREIFKQEWDSRYKATLGEWKDDPKNGLDFWNGESIRNQKKHARLLTTMTKGNRAEWDCTMLFYAILFSDCIHSLSTVVKSNVDNLRLFRNEEFAHIARGHLSDVEFQNGISKVENAFFNSRSFHCGNSRRKNSNMFSHRAAETCFEEGGRPQAGSSGERERNSGEKQKSSRKRKSYSGKQQEIAGKRKGTSGKRRTKEDP